MLEEAKNPEIADVLKILKTWNRQTDTTSVGASIFLHTYYYLEKILKQKGIEFEERKVGDGFTKEDLLEAVPGARTVPQIFLNEKLIGGFTELRAHLANANN